jgi:hypothetical protein
MIFEFSDMLFELSDMLPEISTHCSTSSDGGIPILTHEPSDCSSESSDAGI